MHGTDSICNFQISNKNWFCVVHVAIHIYKFEISNEKWIFVKKNSKNHSVTKFERKCMAIVRAVLLFHVFQAKNSEIYSFFTVQKKL